MKEQLHSRRTFLKLTTAAVISPFLLTGSDLSAEQRYEQAILQRLCAPATESEIEMIQQTLTAELATVPQQVVFQESKPIQTLIGDAQLICYTYNSPHQFVVLAPGQPTGPTYLYIHSLGGLNYDLKQLEQQFNTLRQKGATIIFPLLKGIYDHQAQSEGYLTDNKPHHIHAAIAVVQPFIHTHEMTMLGISLGSQLALSTAASWNLSPTRQKLSQVGLAGPAATIQNTNDLTSAVHSPLAQLFEIPGSALIMKWMIEDFGEKVLRTKGTYQTYQAIMQDPALAQRFRMQLILNSPITYTSYLSEESPLRFKVAHTQSDSIIPPMQTAQVIQKLRDRRQKTEIATIVGDHLNLFDPSVFNFMVS